MVATVCIGRSADTKESCMASDDEVGAIVSFNVASEGAGISSWLSETANPP